MKVRSALLLLCLGFVGGVVVFMLLHKTGLLGLPTTPGAGEGQAVSLVEEAEMAERRIASRFPKGARRPAKSEELTFSLSESDLRDLALAALASREQGRRVLAFSRQVEAQIEDGEIGVTVVLDLSKLPLDELGEKERTVVERISKALPLLGDGDLPVGFYGRPEASEGRLKLTGDPRLRISILKLSVETAAERLGIPEEEIRDALEIEWPGWTVLRVSVEGQSVELVVRSA